MSATYALIQSKLIWVSKVQKEIKLRTNLLLFFIGAKITRL